MTMMHISLSLYVIINSVDLGLEPSIKLDNTEAKWDDWEYKK